ncbi:MAG: formylglycine-generating enzyme family protein [Planctomycetota bacterium]
MTSSPLPAKRRIDRVARDAVAVRALAGAVAVLWGISVAAWGRHLVLDLELRSATGVGLFDLLFAWTADEVRWVASFWEGSEVAALRRRFGSVAALPDYALCLAVGLSGMVLALSRERLRARGLLALLVAVAALARCTWFRHEVARDLAVYGASAHRYDAALLAFGTVFELAATTAGLAYAVWRVVDHDTVARLRLVPYGWWAAIVVVTAFLFLVPPGVALGGALVLLLGVALPVGLLAQPRWAPREPARPESEDQQEAPAQTSAVLGLVAITGGTFRLGSPTTEEGRFGDEGPIDGVEVSSFWIARTPTTRRQWRMLMPQAQCPKQWASDASDDDLPATHVSWDDAVGFCNALSQREGIQPAYPRDGDAVAWDRASDGYRLPTEAEWEYACRAGTTTRYPWGDDRSDDALTVHAWWHKNSGLKPQPVATKPSNAWGLHDMIGNVYEWCWDGFKNTHDSRGRDEVSEGRVVRGGSFFDVVDFARFLRSAFRRRRAPSNRFDFVGFRCVRAPHRQHLAD